MADRDELRGNAILAQLPAREFDALSASAEVVQLETRQPVYDAGGAIPCVYFPIDSVFSMVATTQERTVVEVATIGREGMAGLPLFLGVSSSPHASFCQIAGRSVRLGADDLRRLLGDDGMLHRALSRFTQATMVQMAQNVLCNSVHTAEQRAARWLLTTEDRMGRSEFVLTQEFLAQMLGVRRPTVSDLARRLQGRQLIRYRRGTMVITDRKGLEVAACPCYDILHQEFEATAGEEEPGGGPFPAGC